jgi:hypothetical protein
MSQTARPTVEKNKQNIPNFKEDTLNSHDVALSTADKYFGQGPETESFIECRRRFWEQFPDSHTHNRYRSGFHRTRQKSLHKSCSHVVNI